MQLSNKKGNPVQKIPYVLAIISTRGGIGRNGFKGDNDRL